MTSMQFRIWALAAAGKFFEGFVVFMTGVALPLIAREFEISPAQDGFISAASLFGILVGAVGLGGMSDHFGRKRMFIIEMIIFCAFLVLLILTNGFIPLVICLFGIGLALGCDYPTAHMIISESIPSHSRGKLVLGAFGFQALGALAGTGIGYLVLSFDPTLDAWRWMYATAIIPAVLVTAGRFFITESPNWLQARGAFDRAEREALRLLHRQPQYPTELKLPREAVATGHGSGDSPGFAALFSARNRRATILASVPWFLQDLGTYGIGIFTPTILAAAIGNKPDHVRSASDLILNDIVAAKGAAMITVLLIVGIVFAVLLADRVGRIWLQVVGFRRLRRRSADRLLRRRLHRRDTNDGDLRRLHAVQFHDQPRPQRTNLLVGGRGLPDGYPRHRRGLCRGVRQDRRRRHRLPVSDPARRHRHDGAALYPGRHIGAGRGHHLDVPD